MTRATQRSVSVQGTGVVSSRAGGRCVPAGVEPLRSYFGCGAPARGSEALDKHGTRPGCCPRT
eukprot:1443118-Prymnesium_polylepis.2